MPSTSGSSFQSSDTASSLIGRGVPTRGRWAAEGCEFPPQTKPFPCFGHHAINPVMVPRVSADPPPTTGSVAAGNIAEYRGPFLEDRIAARSEPR